jgi:DNA-binding CsgD family transcriptional regulator
LSRWVDQYELLICFEQVVRLSKHSLDPTRYCVGPLVANPIRGGNMADHLVYLDPHTPVILHTHDRRISEEASEQSEMPRKRIGRLNLRPVNLSDAPASDGGVDSLALIRHRSRNGRRPADSLSPREREVVKLIISGKTRKEVAFDLGVADSTVRVLYARAVRKLAEAKDAESSWPSPIE